MMAFLFAFVETFTGAGSSTPTPNAFNCGNGSGSGNGGNDGNDGNDDVEFVCLNIIHLLCKTNVMLLWGTSKSCFYCRRQSTILNPARLIIILHTHIGYIIIKSIRR